MHKIKKKPAHEQLDLFQSKAISKDKDPEKPENYLESVKTKTQRWGKVGMSSTRESFDYAAEILNKLLDGIDT